MTALIQLVPFGSHSVSRMHLWPGLVLPYGFKDVSVNLGSQTYGPSSYLLNRCNRNGHFKTASQPTCKSESSEHRKNIGASCIMWHIYIPATSCDIYIYRNQQNTTWATSYWTLLMDWIQVSVRTTEQLCFPWQHIFFFFSCLDLACRGEQRCEVRGNLVES